MYGQLVNRLIHYLEINYLKEKHGMEIAYLIMDRMQLSYVKFRNDEILHCSKGAG